mgnify:CR=1 FL=1
MNGTGDGDAPIETAAFEAEELMQALSAEFDGSDAECRVVARQARDLADAGVVAEDRGDPLTVAAVVRDLAAAPPLLLYTPETAGLPSRRCLAR